MKLKSKKVFSLGSGILFAFCGMVGHQASANPYQEIEACGQDVGCVGKVLARMIQRNGSGGGGGGIGKGVTMFHDDGTCESDELIAYVPFGISEDECRRMAGHISTRVWGIQVGQHCKDVRDTSFLGACLKVSAGVIPQSDNVQEVMK